MANGSRCIYCRSTLTGTERREHVIPYSLSAGFANNLTIGCVCDACNDFFGRELEPVFVEDTVLGPLRYRYGVKKDTRRAPVPAPTMLSLTHKGMLLHLHPTDDGEGFRVDLPTQVGFPSVGRPEESFRYFTLAQLDAAVSDPSIDVKSRVHAVGMGTDFREEVAQALRQRGVNARWDSQYHHILPPPTRPSGQVSVDVDFVSLLDRCIRRCMAKVSFNYLAYVTEHRAKHIGWLQQPSFDAVRDYVRRDDAADSPGLTTDVGIRIRYSGTQKPEGHIAAIEWQNTDIVGTVSLFSVFDWQVQLARSFRGVAWNVSSGHFWDLAHRSVERLHPASRRFLPW